MQSCELLAWEDGGRGSKTTPKTPLAYAQLFSFS